MGEETLFQMSKPKSGLISRKMYGLLYARLSPRMLVDIHSYLCARVCILVNNMVTQKRCCLVPGHQEENIILYM